VSSSVNDSIHASNIIAEIKYMYMMSDCVHSVEDTEQ